MGRKKRKKRTAVKLKASDYVGLPKKDSSKAQGVRLTLGCLIMLLDDDDGLVAVRFYVRTELLASFEDC